MLECLKLKNFFHASITLLAKKGFEFCCCHFRFLWTTQAASWERISTQPHSADAFITAINLENVLCRSVSIDFNHHRMREEDRGEKWMEFEICSWNLEPIKPKQGKMMIIVVYVRPFACSSSIHFFTLGLEFIIACYKRQRSDLLMNESPLEFFCLHENNLKQDC